MKEKGNDTSFKKAPFMKEKGND